MPLKLVTPPTLKPLTLVEAKHHLRVDHDADDTYITALIEAAISRIDGKDGMLQRAILTQTWLLTLDTFPTSGHIEIPLPPLQTISSAIYFDAAGDQQTLGYEVDKDSAPARLFPDGGSWPANITSPLGIEIQFVAGYASAAAVPAAVKHGMLLMIGAWYESREEVIVGTIAQAMPLHMGAQALLSPYRVMDA